jgi:hypothetical protein
MGGFCVAHGQGGVCGVGNVKSAEGAVLVAFRDQYVNIHRDFLLPSFILGMPHDSDLNLRRDLCNTCAEARFAELATGELKPGGTVQTGTLTIGRVARSIQCLR